MPAGHFVEKGRKVVPPLTNYGASLGLWGGQATGWKPFRPRWNVAIAGQDGYLNAGLNPTRQFVGVLTLSSPVREFS